MGTSSILRRIRGFISLIFLGWMLCLGARAQSTPIPPASPPTASQFGGRIYGTVTDSAGNVVAGAHVTLETSSWKQQRTQVTQGTGFFDFTGLGPGKYRIAITSQGFAPLTGPEIVLAPGEYHEIPHIELQIASANTSVQVVFSRHDLAEEQMHVEEKQRVLGVVPNFYVSYVWNAAPLSSGQKFRLAFRTSIDPINILGSGVIAGVEQWQNDFSGYGQGGEGYVFGPGDRWIGLSLNRSGSFVQVEQMYS